MAQQRTAIGTEMRGRANLTAAALLLGGWALAAALAFWTGGPLGARFLDLPLGVYIAGQGAVVAVVMLALALAGAREEGDRG